MSQVKELGGDWEELCSESSELAGDKRACLIGYP